MNPQINVAIQVLPLKAGMHPYKVVDKAIEVIKASQLPYKVCPFETVVEGEYDTIMKLIKLIHEVCFQNGTEELIVNIKIQSSVAPVTIFDKMEQYE